MEKVRIGRMQFGHQRSLEGESAQFGHQHCEELARWRRDVRRVAERRARSAWGECPKGWLGNVAEWIGMLVVIALFGGLLWLYLMATPDQASGEADLIGRSQIGHQHWPGDESAQIGHRHWPGDESAQLGHQHWPGDESGDRP